MKRLFLLLGLCAVLLSPTPSLAAIALVSGNTMGAGLTDGTSATTITTAAFTNNITTNNLIIVGCSWASGATTDATVTDSAGNTYTRTESGPTYHSADGVAMTIYYAVVSSGGGTKPTVTCSYWTNTGHGTPSSQNYIVVIASEFSGAATSSVLDQHGTNLYDNVNGVGVTDNWKAPSATVTPGTDNQLVVGFLGQTGGGNGWTAANLNDGTGFSVLTEIATTAPAGYIYGMEYRVQTTATAVQATWTNVSIGGSADGVLALMGTFKDLAGGGGGGDQTFGFRLRLPQ